MRALDAAFCFRERDLSLEIAVFKFTGRFAINLLMHRLDKLGELAPFVARCFIQSNGQSCNTLQRVAQHGAAVLRVGARGLMGSGRVGGGQLGVSEQARRQGG